MLPACTQSGLSGARLNEPLFATASTSSRRAAAVGDRHDLVALGLAAEQQVTQRLHAYGHTGIFKPIGDKGVVVNGLVTSPVASMLPIDQKPAAVLRSPVHALTSPVTV